MLEKYNNLSPEIKHVNSNLFGIKQQFKIKNTLNIRNSLNKIMTGFTECSNVNFYVVNCTIL